jgi:N-acyl-L-homoserine lactone synthetase
MVPIGMSYQSRSVASANDGVTNAFADRVAKLVDRIEYRRADTGEEREAIFRLRYKAYIRDGTISANSSRTFSDPYDEKGNVYLFGLHIDGQLASSLRLHVGSMQHPEFPTLEVFPEYLKPELDAGKIIIDPTRFVVDERLARIYRLLPYATLRLCGMAAIFFHADHLLAAVRAEHQAFYRRIFQHRMVCAPRPYPLLAKPISLMTIDYPTVGEDVYRRYPFFRTSVYEQQRLFSPRQPFSSHQTAASSRKQPSSPGASRQVKIKPACLARR